MYSSFSVPTKCYKPQVQYRYYKPPRIEMNHCHEIERTKLKQKDAFKHYKPCFSLLKRHIQGLIAALFVQLTHSLSDNRAHVLRCYKLHLGCKHVRPSVTKTELNSTHLYVYISHFTSFLFDCKSKDTESLKHCECVNWERWTKSDLIYT